MLCEKCGTKLDITAKECPSCNTRSTPVKFCQKCGEMMPEDAKVCGTCNTRASVPNSPLQWLSLGLSFIAFITFGTLGGDYYLREVNIFDWLTIPISIASLIVAFLYIPKGHIILKVISVIIALLYLALSISWVFSHM